MTTNDQQTGLLTRFVPEKLKHSSIYRWFLRMVRTLQLLSSTISLGIFSSRVYKVYRLVNSFKASRGVNRATGAVEGILAAAVLYTIIATLFSCLKKRNGGGSPLRRWLWVLLDVLFVGAFIAVAVLTRPNGGSAGPRRCYGNRSKTTLASGTNVDRDSTCNLPWGTFLLAILSTILHAITAAFHEVRDHYRRDNSTIGSENSVSKLENGHKNGHHNGIGNGHNNVVGNDHSNVHGSGHHNGVGTGHNPVVGTGHNNAVGIGHQTY